MQYQASFGLTFNYEIGSRTAFLQIRVGLQYYSCLVLGLELINEYFLGAELLTCDLMLRKLDKCFLWFSFFHRKSRILLDETRFHMPNFILCKQLMIIIHCLMNYLTQLSTMTPLSFPTKNTKGHFNSRSQYQILKIITPIEIINFAVFDIFHILNCSFQSNYESFLAKIDQEQGQFRGNEYSLYLDKFPKVSLRGQIFLKNLRPLITSFIFQISLIIFYLISGKSSFLTITQRQLVQQFVDFYAMKNIITLSTFGVYLLTNDYFFLLKMKQNTEKVSFIKVDNVCQIYWWMVIFFYLWQVKRTKTPLLDSFDGNGKSFLKYPTYISLALNFSIANSWISGVQNIFLKIARQLLVFQNLNMWTQEKWVFLIQDSFWQRTLLLTFPHIQQLVDLQFWVLSLKIVIFCFSNCCRYLQLSCIPDSASNLPIQITCTSFMQSSILPATYSHVFWSWAQTLIILLLTYGLNLTKLLQFFAISVSSYLSKQKAAYTNLESYGVDTDFNSEFYYQDALYFFVFSLPCLPLVDYRLFYSYFFSFPCMSHQFQFPSLFYYYFYFSPQMPFYSASQLGRASKTIDQPCSRSGVSSQSSSYSIQLFFMLFVGSDLY